MQQLPLILEHRRLLGREDFLVSPCNIEVIEWIDSYPEWCDVNGVVVLGDKSSGKTHLSWLFCEKSSAKFYDVLEIRNEIFSDVVPLNSALVIDNIDVAIGDYELEELQKSNKAYIVTDVGEHNLDGGNPNIYFLLENRQKIGWDAHLPGHGMMISKVIYDENKWYNNVPNNDKNSQGYDLIEADGKAPNGSYGKAGDLFPGTAKVTSYAPCAKYSIIDIEEVDSVISFSFVVEKEVSIDNEECVFELINRLNSSELFGVSIGTIVDCYDSVGRLLWRKECVSNSLTFETPHGLYILRVIDGEKVNVIKGI